MEADMMNIVSSSAAGATVNSKGSSVSDLQARSSSGGTADFSAALVQVIGEDMEEATVDPQNSGFMMLLSTMNPAVLLNMMPQSQLANFEEAAQNVMEIMNEDPSVLQSSILSNPLFQEWLAQANRVLGSMEAGLGDGYWKQQRLIFSTPAASMQGNSESAQTADQVIKLLTSFLSVSQHYPNDNALLKLQQSLQSLFQPLADSMNQGSSNAVQQSLAKSQVSETVLNGIPNALSSNMPNHAARLQAVPGNTTLVLQNNELLSDQSTLVNALQGPAQPVLVQHPKLMAVQPIIQSENPNTEADQQTVLPTDTTVILTQQDLMRPLSDSISKMVPQTVSIPNFVQDMTNFMMKNFKISQSGGISEAKISLTPEHLGQVDVKITMHNGQMVAHFMTETALGREAIENQLSQLRTALQTQGIQVDKLEVSQGSSLQSGLFQDQRHHQPSQQFGRQPRERNMYAGEAAGTSDFDRNALTAYAMHGGSFNVTA